MILRAKSGPRLVHGYYVAMTWLVPVSYEGGPHLPPIMAISEQFALLQSRAAITIPDSALPPSPRPDLVGHLARLVVFLQRLDVVAVLAQGGDAQRGGFGPA